MRTHRDDGSTDRVVTLTGDVGAGAVDQLRHDLLEALAGGHDDVLLDARETTAFDDAALAALVVARSAARWHRRRLVVLDADGGALERSLHRTGLFPQFPVYRDAASASTAIAGDRAALAAMDTPLEARWRAVHAEEDAQEPGREDTGRGGGAGAPPTGRGGSSPGSAAR